MAALFGPLPHIHLNCLSHPPNSIGVLLKRVFFFAEPKKEKTDQSNGTLSPSVEQPLPGAVPCSTALPVPGGGELKPERPSSLGPGKLTRRLLCYHSEHCKSKKYTRSIWTVFLVVVRSRRPWDIPRAFSTLHDFLDVRIIHWPRPRPSCPCDLTVYKHFYFYLHALAFQKKTTNYF